MCDNKIRTEFLFQPGVLDSSSVATIVPCTYAVSGIECYFRGFRPVLSFAFIYMTYFLWYKLMAHELLKKCPLFQTRRQILTKKCLNQVRSCIFVFHAYTDGFSRLFCA